MLLLRRFRPQRTAAPLAGRLSARDCDEVRHALRLVNQLRLARVRAAQIRRIRRVQERVGVIEVEVLKLEELLDLARDVPHQVQL